MKGFLRLLLVAAISVSMSACGDKAKEPTPEEKAAQYAESIFKAIEESDFEKLDVISEDLNGYIGSIDESQGEAFVRRADLPIQRKVRLRRGVRRQFSGGSVGRAVLFGGVRRRVVPD